MPLTAGLILTLVTAGWALWVRRDCWFSPWERAANIAIVLQITALSMLFDDACGCPSDSYWDDFVAHCLYIWSVAAIGYHVALRLTGVAPRVKRRAIMALIPLTGVRFALVASGHLSLYWVTVGATWIGLLLWICWVMAELWADPKHRRTVTIYMAASAVGILTAAAQVASAVRDDDASIEGTPLVWAGCCLVTIGFAAGFGYSWTRRARALKPVAPAY